MQLKRYGNTDVLPRGDELKTQPEAGLKLQKIPKPGLEIVFEEVTHLPISLFLSFVVQLWKNSVIRLSRARRDASSDA